MPNVLSHLFVSSKSDAADASLVRPSDWNNEHAFSGGAQGQLIFRQTAISGGAGWSGNSLLWDSVNKFLTVGGPLGGSAHLQIAGGSLVARFERAAANTTTAVDVNELVHRSSTDMADGFGLRIPFIIRDNAGADNTIARLIATRKGGDTTGKFSIQTAIASATPADRLVVDENGNIFGKAMFPVNIRAFDAVCDGTTNDDAAIQAAIATGARWIFLPRNTKWIPLSGANPIIPINCNIFGEDSTVKVDAATASGGPGSLTIGNHASLSNVSFADDSDSGAYHYMGFTGFYGANGICGSDGQDIFYNVVKTGPSGSVRQVGIAVSHAGDGSGDNFYGSTTTTADEFFDALFRGDLFNVGTGTPPSGLGYGTVFGANLILGCPDVATAINVQDKRTTGGTSGVVVIGTTSRTDSNPLIGIAHSASTFSGPAISIAMAQGSGVWTGNFIETSNAGGGAIKFKVASDGTITTAGDIACAGSLGVTGNISAGAAFFIGAVGGLTVTKTVRAAGGLSDCTLVFTGGILTGGSC